MNAVRWDEIEHAFGPATDVPELIRTVAQGAEPEALKACAELSEALNHQDSVYPACGPAVPLLIEALARAAPPVRVGPLRLLAGIAEGAAEAIDAGMILTSTLESSGISFRQVFTAVWRGTGLYVRLLAGDPDADVRMRAAHTLGVLVGPGPAFAPADVSPGFATAVEALFERLSAEQDNLALASVAVALRPVATYDERVRAELRELLAAADEAVRVAAALALVEADGEGHEEIAAVDLLVEEMSRAPETDLLFQPRAGARNQDVRWLPWVWGRLRFRLCRALCSWSRGDEQRMLRVLPALLTGVRAANAYTADADIGLVLQWLWPGRSIRMRLGENGNAETDLPPPVTAAELTGIRRTVVEACYANTRVWNSSIGNADLAFMEVGLPTSRAQVGKLLGKRWTFLGMR